MSSPVFTTTVTSRGNGPDQSAEELPRADPARERHDLHAKQSVVGSAVAAVTTRAALRRALARAGPGRPLSLEEAERAHRRRGERTSSGSGASPRGLRDLGHGQTASRTPARSSSRSPCCAATTVTTARSRSRPRSSTTPFLTPEEVVAIAEGGSEDRAARRRSSRWATGRRSGTTWLAMAGASAVTARRSTTSARSAIRVIEETGLLPHLNPGVMSYEELARLKHVSASMGLMLETSSDRLSAARGPHFGSPDKVPAVRLRTIEDAGRLAIPFTTGHPRRASARRARARRASLFAIRDLHRRYRHVQEVIVQNFRAKPGTAMATHPSRTTRSSWQPSPRRAIVLGPAHERPGAAEPLRSRRSSCGCWTPGSTIGAACRRSRPTT